MGEGKEGDWECGGCRNRNYAFRSFCNRCKQPRLLVDTKTPADSKWLPRIGDWICSGCTNNNYASREKCKKCGQPKEVAAIPATAMPGVSLQTYSHYFAGTSDPKLNLGLLGTCDPQQSLLQSSNWFTGGVDKHGVQPALAWSLGGNGSLLPYANPGSQVPCFPKGWRTGDWICNCGFHNYSSRAQCKNCGALPQALGTKRLASEEFVHDWDNKRLNIGQIFGQQQSFQGFVTAGSSSDANMGLIASHSSLSSGIIPSLDVPMKFLQQATTPTLLGKGAKQWRVGDWMCSNCNNHNYASRAHCNRCKTQRDKLSLPVNAI